MVRNVIEYFIVYNFLIIFPNKICIQVNIFISSCLNVMLQIASYNDYKRIKKGNNVSKMDQKHLK